MTEEGIFIIFSMFLFFTIMFFCIFKVVKNKFFSEIKNTNANIDNNIISKPKDLEKFNSTSSPESTKSSDATTNTEISDEEVLKLIEEGKELAMKQWQERKKLLGRTFKDEELSFRFECKHHQEIEKHTTNFEELGILAFQTKDINERIKLLEKTISEFEKSKKWFYRTKGGMIFFQDFYERLYNSKNECFSYIDDTKRYLKESIEERDIIIPKIIELASSEKGIIQKDLYKYFDNPKSQIQRIVRYLEAKKIIFRTKKGNSFLITTK